MLYEYHDTGHNGIDHVWHSNSIGHKYRITDSKATNLASHRKIMTPKKAAMDALSMGLDVYVKSSKEEKTKGALSKTASDGAQMSHLWISKKINSAQIIPNHSSFITKIKAWERVRFKASTEKEWVKQLRYSVLMIGAW